MGVSEKWSLRYVVGPRSIQIGLSTQHVQREYSTEPSMRRILCD